MRDWGSYSYLFGPATALLVVGVLALLLRWAFGPTTSLVARAPRTGEPHDYGLLVPVATPRSPAEGDALTHRLQAAGVAATLTQTRAGLRILVWPADAERAREVLGGADRG